MPLLNATSPPLRGAVRREVPAAATPSSDVPGQAPTLSVVVCARNEAASVLEVLRRLRASFPQAELILVDNASTDDTGSVAASLEFVRVVQEPVQGKGAAIRAGVQNATGAWVLLHDADLEYCIEDAPAVVACAIANNACCVGMRLVSYEQLRIASWFANRLIQGILKARLGVRMPDVLSGTRCLRREVFLALETTSVRFGIETEMARALARQRVSCLSAPVRFSPRSVAQGKKIRMWDLLELVAQALK